MISVLLAYGEKADMTGSGLGLLLLCALILALAAVLAAIPSMLARRLGSAWREVITPASFLWGAATACSAGAAAIAEFKWSGERKNLLLSGYYDPSTKGDGPQHPWAWWLALTGIYVILVALAFVRTRSDPRGPSETPGVR